MRLPSAFILIGSILAMALAGCIAPSEDGAPLPAEALPQGPVVVHEVLEGKLVCGVGTPFGTANPCLLAEESRNVFQFSVKPDIQTLLLGLTWDHTTLLGKELQLLVESRGFTTVHNDETRRYGSAAGEADLVVRIDAVDLAGTEWSWDDLTAALELQARVFPARNLPPSVILDQPFVLHVVSFYGAPAPEGVDPFAATENAPT